MQYCSKCGTALVDDAIVCTGCGCAVSRPAAVAEAAPATAPAAAPNAYAPNTYAPNGAPNYAPNGAPNYAPNGAPNYAPNGAPVYPPNAYAPNGYAPNAYAPKKASGLATAAKILMIVSTVIMGFYLIPLAWCLPMTLHYCKCIKTGQPVSVAFKVCTILFVNVIGGILMFCDESN